MTNLVFAGYLADYLTSSTAYVLVPSATSLPSGAVKTAVIAGGAAGDHTVTGITTSDNLISVIRFDLDATAANIDVDDLTSEFSISAADTINNDSGTATTGDKLLVVYANKA